MSGIAHVLGLDMSGYWAGFWQGPGGELSILATPLVLARRHNCHVKWCWRLGRHQTFHPVTGATLMVCRKHHPDDHPTAADVAAPAGRPGAT